MTNRSFPTHLGSERPRAPVKEKKPSMTMAEMIAQELEELGGDEEGLSVND